MRVGKRWLACHHAWLGNCIFCFLRFTHLEVCSFGIFQTRISHLTFPLAHTQTVITSCPCEIDWEHLGQAACTVFAFWSCWLSWLHSKLKLLCTARGYWNYSVSTCRSGDGCLCYCVGWDEHPLLWSNMLGVLLGLFFHTSIIIQQ